MLDRKPAVMAELVMLAVVAAIKFRTYRKKVVDIHGENTGFWMI